MNNNQSSYQIRSQSSHLSSKRDQSETQLLEGKGRKICSSKKTLGLTKIPHYRSTKRRGWGAKSRPVLKSKLSWEMEQVMWDVLEGSSVSEDRCSSFIESIEKDATR